MQLADLSQLPPWAVIAFGISLAIIVGLAWVGERRGKNGGPANAASSAQVAAVIVDPTALNAAAGEVSGLALAVHELVVVLKEAACSPSERPKSSTPSGKSCASIVR